jgi:glucosamine kinase
MKLIVDSGSTKAKWAFIDNDKVSYLDTSGINPHFATEKDIVPILKEVNIHAIKPIEEIYFYGSGVTSKLLTESLENLFRMFVCREGKITIETDLKGACIALFGMEVGIGCILGTGAATGLFNGNEVVNKIPSLGFWLGDEGSGADLGKRLIKAYLRKELSGELIVFFEEEYGSFNREFVFKKIETESRVNAFFASFCLFLKKYEDKSEIVELLEIAFDEFIKHHLLNFEIDDDIKIGYVGSIAYNFKDILRKRMAMYFDNEIVILANPLESLVNFHVTNVQ